MNVVHGSLSSLPDRVSGQLWARLPTRTLGQGGRIGRLAICFEGGEGGFLSITVAAKGDRFTLRLQIVEIRPIGDGEQDPRLGQIVIDGRTVRFGLATSEWRKASGTTLTTLATCNYDALVQALLNGRELEVRLDGRRFTVGLDSLRRLLADALREVCDPERLPLSRWLAG
ncbi:hypothetical protein [Benzoatithermus flavus]|uniref:SCP2 domain-containing protein n=1 Tax=Benzoatithermus flavus TaxID=3108223 RepID=A0ABU8XT01_9PROT